MPSRNEERLSRREASRLAALELVIERAEADRGQALSEVREYRLYRQEYATFEQYCQQRWGISGDYGRKLIRHVEVSQTIVGLTPANEGQTRELERLDPEQAATVMKHASESGAKVTAKKIREARTEVIKTEPAKRYMPTREEKERRLDEAVRLWSEGYYREDICAALGISASTLNMDLASRNISGRRDVAGMKPKGHPIEIADWRNPPEQDEANVVRLKLVPGKAACDLDRESADRLINKADAGSEHLGQYIKNGYELTDSQVERLGMIRNRIDTLIREAQHHQASG